MNRRLAYIAILVRDYDEAIDYYTKTLDFELIEDTVLSDTKRWVLVSPCRGNTSLLLARAANEEQKSRIGNQTGGRVFLFLHTDDFDRDYSALRQKNVKIIRPETHEAHGKVAVFEDLYGNLWDLIEPKDN